MTFPAADERPPGPAPAPATDVGLGQRVRRLEEEIERLRRSAWAGPSLSGRLPKAEVRDALPVAGEENAYRIVALRGTPDTLYICLRASNGAWVWTPIVAGELQPPPFIDAGDGQFFSGVNPQNGTYTFSTQNLVAQDGDLLILVAWGQDESASITPTISVSTAGWTQVATGTDGTNRSRLSVFRKVAAGDTAVSYQVSTGITNVRGGAVVLAYRNGAVNVAGTFATGTSAAAITTTAAKERVVVVTGGHDTGNPDIASTGVVERFEGYEAVSDVNLWVGDYVQDIAGDTGSKTVTAIATGQLTGQFSIQPA